MSLDKLYDTYGHFEEYIETKCYYREMKGTTYGPVCTSADDTPDLR